MKDRRNYMRGLGLYALVLGVIYVSLGSMEFILGFFDMFLGGTPLSCLWIPVDLFGGFSAFVIGLTYLAAVRLLKGEYESISYVLVATMLSTVFGVLYVLIFLANGLSAYLSGEEWSWIVDLARPEIWLFISSTPLAYSTWSTARKPS